MKWKEIPVQKNLQLKIQVSYKQKNKTQIFLLKVTLNPKVGGFRHVPNNGGECDSSHWKPQRKSAICNE